MRELLQAIRNDLAATARMDAIAIDACGLCEYFSFLMSAFQAALHFITL